MDEKASDDGKILTVTGVEFFPLKEGPKRYLRMFLEIKRERFRRPSGLLQKRFDSTRLESSVSVASSVYA